MTQLNDPRHSTIQFVSSLVIIGGMVLYAATSIYGTPFPAVVERVALATLVIVTWAPVAWWSTDSSVDNPAGEASPAEMTLLFGLWTVTGAAILGIGWGTWVSWTITGIGAAGILSAGAIRLHESRDGSPA